MYGIVATTEGHHVTILERSPETLRAQSGAGLGVANALATFMQRYDHSKEPYFLSPPEALYVDSCGQQINITRPGISATSWTTLYSRLRARFDGSTSSIVQPPYCGISEDGFELGSSRYVNGAEVIAVQKGNGLMQVEYLDVCQQKVSKLSADLVIAADGAGSKIRVVFAPFISCRYVGYAAWRGTVLEKDMKKDAKVQSQRNDRHCKIERSFFLS